MSKFSRIETVFLRTNKKINFEFNGKKYSGFYGDTLASALLANNVILIGRSFKYHRPRGIISSGSHEPNALVEIIHKNFTEPNIKATTVELYNGLKARSQNCWPSVKLDFMSINDKISNFIGAGFYYKTFMWPSFLWEKLYEPLIRKAAGLGKLSQSKKNRVSEKGFLHTDILIIGSGPSGLMSAYIAGLSGARVLLVEEDFVYGGSLNNESFDISNMSSQAWVMSVLEELQKLPNVRIMKRTCVFGMFDHGIFGAIEKLKDSKIEQIFWKIVSKKSLLCSGSLERFIPFQNNDLPGIMLSGSIRSYINRWGIKSFSDVLLFTNNDDAYSTAIDLIENGINCLGVIDTRENPRTFDPRIKVYKTLKL